MKTNNEIFLGMFKQINSAEDCPYGRDLLVWDGCDFHQDYIDVDMNTGYGYFANGTDGIAYIELPDQDLCEGILGDGEQLCLNL